MKNLVSIYNIFHAFGGAQKILIRLHKTFESRFISSKIIGFTKEKLVHRDYDNYNLNYSYFVKFNNLKFLKNTLFISHSRKATTFLVLLNKVFKKIRIIHIAHNEFYSLSKLSLYPDEIIAVSERVKKNLVNEFGISEKSIAVIYNGLKDFYLNNFEYKKKDNNKKVKILYPSRITKVKNQVELVKQLRGNIYNCEIIFAGEGALYESLLEEVGKNENFKVLGQVKDIKKLFLEVDYIMLYSQKEGLPLSLIEATMFGKPIIANNVGGNTEILKNKYNGFLVNSYPELINCINSLYKIEENEYMDLCLNSRKVYEEKFTEEKMIENYTNYLYKYFYVK